jgi:hypothetical protein
MSNPIQDAVLKACRHFMIPIARFLLRNGVGYREFAEIGKLAFVQVASDEYGIRGRKTNMSRVAVMTGLTRKEVRRVRDRLTESNWSLDPQLSRPGVVLSHWFTDPDFATPGGRPRALPLDAEQGQASFASLVKKYGGDIPPGAMLKELERAGCVRSDGRGNWHVVRREFSPGGTDTFLIQRFGECIHDLADTMAHNMALGPTDERHFEFRAWNDRIDTRHVRALRQIVAEKGREYLESVDDWLGDHETQEESPASNATCGVGVFYFERATSDSSEGG